MANKTETARAKCPFYEGFGKQCIKCRAREDRLVTVSFSSKNGRSGALCRATYQRANCDVVQNRLEPEAQCPIFQALWTDWERTQEQELLQVFTKELKFPSGNNQGDDKNKVVEESLGIKNVCGSGRKSGCFPKKD